MSIEKYKYNNFTYEVDDNYNWSIKKEGQIIPEKIFKYYSCREYNLEAFIKGYFYISHPYDLNDSMDCNENIIDYSGLTYDQFQSFIKVHNLNWDYTTQKAKHFKDVKEFFWEIHLVKWGILSLSENFLHPLMWSHYSGDTGFLIDLSPSSIIENIRTPIGSNPNLWLNNYCFSPINYVPKLQKIPVFNNDKWNTPTIPLMYSVNIKTDEWNYENEWRLICFSNDDLTIPYSKKFTKVLDYEKSDRKLFYSAQSINSIILGKNFFISDEIVDFKKDGDTIRLFFAQNTKSNYVRFIKKVCSSFNQKLYICDIRNDINGDLIRVARKLLISEIEAYVFEIQYTNIEYSIDS